MDKSANKPSILIVDDTPENLIALEILLKKLDLDIVTAESGNEALNATLHHDFSLILLDVMMPEMDGYEVAELIKTDDKAADIPIIFISAMDKSDAMEIKGYSRGAVDFIFKPINEIVLISKIKVYLELYRMKKYIEKIILRQRIEKPKILIVDDNPENLFALEKILRKLDADIEKANSGNEALSSILYSDFALIILDVQMPEMDGYEVAEILKSDEKTENIPIIFVTAIDRNDAKEIKGYHKGAVDFIFKPLNEFILVSKVKVFLEIYRIKCGLEELVSERTRALNRTNEELARARLYLQNVVNSISSWLISVDSKGNIIDMNREAQKRSGFSAEEALGRPVRDIYPFYGELTEEIMRSMALGEPVENSRVTVYIDDKLHVKNFAVYPLTDDGIQGAVIRIDDVTQQARIDEMMIQSEKMLSIGGLAAGMAHEINNPIAGIIQTAQVIRNRMNNELPRNISTAEACGTTMEAVTAYMEKRKILKMVDTVMESGMRAALIVENMLSFSRKSEGSAKEENLCELMDRTVDLAENDFNLKKNFDFRQIEVIREYQPDMPKLLCQGGKIQQVILNILRNGAQAMALKKKENEGTHRFVLRINEDNDMARLEIEDSGSGMDQALCNRIFEPFFTTKKQGTGLGLSISNFIITEDHGGTMEVASTPGKGSKFIIRLPFKRLQGHSSSAFRLT